MPWCSSALGDAFGYLSDDGKSPAQRYYRQKFHFWMIDLTAVRCWCFLYPTTLIIIITFFQGWVFFIYFHNFSQAKPFWNWRKGWKGRCFIDYTLNGYMKEKQSFNFFVIEKYFFSQSPCLGFLKEYPSLHLISIRITYLCTTYVVHLISDMSCKILLKSHLLYSTMDFNSIWIFFLAYIHLG